MYHYNAFVMREISEYFPNGVYCIEVPQLLGCCTFEEDPSKVVSTTREAIMGWLLSNLDSKDPNILPLEDDNIDAAHYSLPATENNVIIPIVLTEEDMNKITRETSAL